MLRLRAAAGGASAALCPPSRGARTRGSGAVRVTAGGGAVWFFPQTRRKRRAGSREPAPRRGAAAPGAPGAPPSALCHRPSALSPPASRATRPHRAWVSAALLSASHLPLLAPQRGGGVLGGAGNAPAGLSLPRGYGEKSPRLAPRKSCLRRAEPGAIPLSGDARFEFHAKAFCGTLQCSLRKQPAERQLPRSTACRRCRRSRAVDPPPLLLRGRLSSAAAEAVQNAGTASACRCYLQVFRVPHAVRSLLATGFIGIAGSS